MLGDGGFARRYGAECITGFGHHGGGAGGHVVGGLSGFVGGRLDLLTQRFVDAWMAFPGLLLLMTSWRSWVPVPCSYEFRGESLLLEVLFESEHVSKAAVTHRVKADAVDQREVPAAGGE